VVKKAAVSEAPAGPTRVGLISLGCPKNLIDSEVMLGKVAGADADGAGVAIVGDANHADIMVVNTCAFVEAAKRESLAAILEMLELKKRGVIKGVVVTGCMAQRYPDELKAEVPDVDAIVGVTAEDEVADLVPQIARAHDHAHRHDHAPARGKGPKKLPMARTAAADGTPEGPRVVIRDPSRPFGAEVGRLRLTPRHYGYLRVAEGCDHACTFCAIPGFRGRFRSKPEQAILDEARELAQDGAKELCLIAEDTNQYGQDRRDGTNLALLLEKLAKTDGVEWLRILYAYPAYFPETLVKVIANTPQVVKYLDIPLQHIADPVLRRMNRPGKKKTVELLERLRKGIPGLALRTTFIVGFPGETDQDFEELLSFVKEFGFDRLGAFPFSEEDGTPAGTMEGQLPQSVREERRDRIMAAQQEIAFARNQAKVGSTVRAIVDEPEGKGRAVARTEHDAPEIDGELRLYQKGRIFVPGELLNVRVVKAVGYDLEGAPVA